MTVKTTKNVLVFGIIVTAVFLGTTFVMASSPSGAVAPPSEGIARAAFSDDIVGMPRVALMQRELTDAWLFIREPEPVYPLA